MTDSPWRGEMLVPPNLGGKHRRFRAASDGDLVARVTWPFLIAARLDGRRPWVGCC